MVAYRNLMIGLIKLFLILTILSVPLIKIYSDGQSVKNEASKYAGFSLGQMGYESVQCSFIPFSMGTLILDCPYGRITNVLGKGINTHDQVVRDACINKKEFKNDKCDKIIKQDHLDTLIKGCKNQKSCTIKTTVKDEEGNYQTNKQLFKST